MFLLIDLFKASFSSLLTVLLGWEPFTSTEDRLDEKQVLADHGYECFAEDGTVTVRYKNDIRQVLRDFMAAIGITYPSVTFDAEFAQSCCEVALEKGFSPEIVQSEAFQVALHGAVAIARNTYIHLENTSTQQWIALYTTCLIYFDDLTRTDATATREFHQRFILGQPQMHPLLDSFAGLLRASWEHFLPACANLVVSASLDFVSGLIIDHDQQEMPVSKHATSYPRWIRTIMGVSTCFVIFTFPPEIPLTSYIQIIPDMVNYIDDVNDLFSFYKEECVHENTNHISLLAKLTGRSKLDCMKYLAEYSINGSRRCQAVLSADPRALDIFDNHFLQGYVAFHAAASLRYKLHDLDLE